MAQRMIHYLIGVHLMNMEPVNNMERFLFGSILPDAYGNVMDRDATHYRVTENGRIYYDFNRFQKEYRDEILSDDLFLGYYMHLVEDILYRRFVRVDYHLRIFGEEKNVRLLHQDYHLLNAYIVKTYQLQNFLQNTKIRLPDKIGKIADFRTEAFLKLFDEDFHEDIKSAHTYIDEKMLEEFLEKYEPVIKQEFQKVRAGESGMQAKDYSWEK